MSEERPPKHSPTPDPVEGEFGGLFAAVQKAARFERSAAKTEDSELRIEDERKTLEVGGLRDELERLKNLHTIRKVYLGLLFSLTVVWLLIVVVCVLMAGFHFSGFTLSDSVLIAFITSTTLSVLGLFHFAAKWLYPSKG